MTDLGSPEGYLFRVSVWQNSSEILVSFLRTYGPAFEFKCLRINLGSKKNSTKNFRPCKSRDGGDLLFVGGGGGGLY